jgi:hypothetical protein
MCEKLYLQNISREGRCSRLQGDFKTMCRAGGDLLPDRLTKIFEQDLLKFLAAESAEILALGKSLESSQIIGRKMFFHQCLDGSVCNNTYFPTVLEAVQPSPGEVSEKVQDLLAYRHRSTGSSALVEYHCEVQNETCAALTNTDAAHSLPKKDFEILRMQISQANRQRPFKKAAFLEQASALRPLGQCCSSTACRSKLQALTAGAVKFSDSERTAK